MEIIYIEFLNKDKNFNKDEVEFEKYSEALSWGKNNLDNFSTDMLKFKTCNEEDLNLHYVKSKIKYNVPGESHSNYYKSKYPIRYKHLLKLSEKNEETKKIKRFKR